MSDNRRSRMITEGVQRTPNRAMLRAVGFRDADFTKPIVGIANMYSNLPPCNDNLDVLGQRVAAAIRAADAMPQLYGTITIADGLARRQEPRPELRPGLCPDSPR